MNSDKRFFIERKVYKRGFALFDVMEGIVARCIVEIMGAPKEFIEQKLKEHVDKLKEDKLKILKERYEEPEQKDKMFSQFVELEIHFKDLTEFLDFCYDSMPSTVEILKPEEIVIDMAAFEDFINDFQTRLHHTDMMLKTLTAQKSVLDKNAINILHNFILFVCKQKPQTLAELSKITGVNESELKQFVDGLVTKGGLKKEGEAFVRNG